VLGGVFICYRREDSGGFAGRIYDRLRNRLGRENVFFDVDNIAPGLDFVDVLTERVGYCDALIAVIGRQWITTTNKDNRRRLDDPTDFVRIEIEAALARGIPVIPVLADGATMPRAEDLPDSLRKLARRQGIEISHTRFDSDVERLTRALSELEEDLAQNQPGDWQESNKPRASNAGKESRRTRFGLAAIPTVGRDREVDHGVGSRVAVEDPTTGARGAPIASQPSRRGVWFGALAFAAVALFALVLASPRFLNMPLRCLVGSSGCPPVAPGAIEAVCPKSSERIAAVSCGPPGDDYVVTNVSPNDPDGGLNLRDKPALSGAKIGFLPFNSTGVKIGPCAAGGDAKRWCPTECEARGLRGWVSASYVTLRSGDLYSVTAIAENDVGGLKIRNGADIACDVVATAPPDAREIVLHLCQLSSDYVSRWCLVTYKNASGWVPYQNLRQQN
jgi:hypothetical protein